MYDGLIPQRYAMALYKFASDNHKTEEVYNVMRTVLASFDAEPSLEKVLANPFVGRDDKQKLLVAAGGPGAGPDYLRFVNLILDHNREMFARQMAFAYRDIYRRDNKISSVRITTAAELPADEQKRIDGLVAKAYPDRVLEIQHGVDPSLIGGFVIDVDNNRLDASISSEILQLRQNLISSN